LFIPLAAQGAEYNLRVGAKPHWFGAGILAASIVTVGMVGLYFVQSAFFPMDTARYLAGRVSQCERDGLYCQAMESVNEEAEPGARVFLAAYHRYWLRPDLLQCLYRQADAQVIETESSEAAWLGIYRRGFRYLLIDRSTHASVIANFDTSHTPPWLQIVPIFEKAHLSAYGLDFSDPPGEPLVECRQLSPPAWDVVAR